MMEAWSSGRFKTYPQLPGWTGPPWSLLLIPGWTDLVGAPLNEIVAQQWATTTHAMLDDLSRLQPQSWTPVRYEDVIAAPQREIARLCRALGLGWDRPLAPGLPLARNTLSPPDAQKWRAHGAAIEAVLPMLAAQSQRATALFDSASVLQSR